MAFKTPVTELFEIEHPVLLAPMALASGGALAAAVSKAGGLGLIGGGYGDARQLEDEFAAAGNVRVGVGFITWSLAKQPALLDQALSHAPAAIMLSFGDPRPFAGAIKAAGAKLICQVQSVRGAQTAAEAGADAIVAQGAEAGGHGASRGTLGLTPAVVDEVPSIPVLAAGGIADGRGLAAALMLGAAGALVGTLFLATPECLWPESFKDRVVKARGDDTVRTSVFDRLRGIDWPADYTGRAIRNATFERWLLHERELSRIVDEECVRYDASPQDDAETRVVYAGEAVDQIDAVMPADERLVRLVADAEALLSAKAGAVA